MQEGHGLLPEGAMAFLYYIVILHMIYVPFPLSMFSALLFPVIPGFHDGIDNIHVLRAVFFIHGGCCLLEPGLFLR